MGRLRGKTWWSVAAIAVIAAAVFAWILWSQHQQLAVAEASVPANMHLAGAVRGQEIKQYSPVAGAPDAPGFLGVTYTLNDGEAALKDAESQLAADGWTLVSQTTGDTTELQYAKDGSGIRGVMVTTDGATLTVTITPE